MPSRRPDSRRSQRRRSTTRRGSSLSALPPTAKGRRPVDGEAENDVQLLREEASDPRPGKLTGMRDTQGDEADGEYGNRLAQAIEEKDAINTDVPGCESPVC